MQTVYDKLKQLKPNQYLVNNDIKYTQRRNSDVVECVYKEDRKEISSLIYIESLEVISLDNDYIICDM